MATMAAAMSTEKGNCTTAAIAERVGVPLRTAQVALAKLEEQRLVERTRERHNRAIWRPTANGSATLLEVLTSKLKIHHDKYLGTVFDPLPAVIGAAAVAGKLRKLGWTEGQIRRRLRFRTVGNLNRCLRAAKKVHAENPGAYVQSATRSRKSAAFV